MSGAVISNYIKNKTLTVLVKPSSPKTEIKNFDKRKQALKINLKAPPEKGKANLELIKFFKKQFKRDIKIISGATSHKKLVKFL